MQSILLYFSALFTLMSAAGPSAPPSRGGDGPSGAAIMTLVCGVVSWLFLPVLAALVGIFVGRGELKAIREGRSPQSGELITKIGYYVCIANLLMTILGGCLSFALIALIWGGVIAGVGGIAIFQEIANALPN